MKSGDSCPVCERGSLSLSTYSGRFMHRGAELEIGDLVSWLCDMCGERTMEPQQIRANNAKVAQAKRDHADAQRSDDLLATEDVRQVRALLGLTQAEASQVFRGGANAFSKYERGEVIQSEPMDLLLRLARDVPLAAKWLYERAGLSPAAVPEKYA